MIFLNGFVSYVMNKIKGVYKFVEIVCKILFVFMYIFWEGRYLFYIGFIYFIFGGEYIYNLN